MVVIVMKDLFLHIKIYALNYLYRICVFSCESLRNFIHVVNYCYFLTSM